MSFMNFSIHIIQLFAFMATYNKVYHAMPSHGNRQFHYYAMVCAICKLSLTVMMPSAVMMLQCLGPLCLQHAVVTTVRESQVSTLPD